MSRVFTSGASGTRAERRGKRCVGFRPTASSRRGVHGGTKRRRNVSLCIPVAGVTLRSSRLRAGLKTKLAACRSGYVRSIVPGPRPARPPGPRPARGATVTADRPRGGARRQALENVVMRALPPGPRYAGGGGLCARVPGCAASAYGIIYHRRYPPSPRPSQPARATEHAAEHRSVSL